MLAISISLIVEGGDGRDTVTASGSAPPAGAPAEVPRAVEVRCEPTGIVVPVASVRTQNDGLHIRVHNLLGAATTLRVTGREGWSSGDVDVEVGVNEVRQPVPPGKVTIGCAVGGELQRRQVSLVDLAGYYTRPALDCDDAGVERLRNLAIDPPERSLVAAARAGLDQHLIGGTKNVPAVAPRGYPAQKLSDPTDDPTVQIEREGRVVAFAHVRGEDGAPEGPWITVQWAEVCASDVAVADDAGSDATTTTAGDEDATATTAAP